MGLERAVAIPQQKTDGVTLNVPTIRRHNISLPIVVEVADRHPSWKRGGRVIDMGLEGAVAVAEEEANRTRRRVVRGYDILLAITVEFANRDGSGRTGGSEVLPRLESAVSVPEQHTDRIVIQVGHDKIVLPIAVNIPNGH